MLVNDTNLPKVIIVQGEKKKERQKKRDEKKEKNTHKWKKGVWLFNIVVRFSYLPKTSPLYASQTDRHYLLLQQAFLKEFFNVA